MKAMRVERGDLPQDNFTIIANAAIDAAEVSLKALGLYVWLASRPPQWATTVERIAQVRPDTEYAIGKCLNELVTAGLVARRRDVTPGGGWTQVLHLGTISRIPKTEDLEIPGSRNPKSDSTANSKTENKTNSRGENLFEQPGQRATTPSDCSKQALEQERSAAFAEFWDAYPRKVGKPKALAAWKTRVVKLVEPVEVLAGLLWWRAKWAEDKTQSNFMPYPATWLNDERWRDALPAPNVDEDIEPDDDATDAEWAVWYRKHPEEFAKLGHA